jgi:hypothetical protein
MLYYNSIVSEERYTGKPHFDVTGHSSLARNFGSLVQSTEWRLQGTALHLWMLLSHGQR